MSVSVTSLGVWFLGIVGIFSCGLGTIFSDLGTFSCGLGTSCSDSGSISKDFCLGVLPGEQNLSDEALGAQPSGKQNLGNKSLGKQPGEKGSKSWGTKHCESNLGRAEFGEQNLVRAT